MVLCLLGISWMRVLIKFLLERKAYIICEEALAGMLVLGVLECIRDILG